MFNFNKLLKWINENENKKIITLYNYLPITFNLKISFIVIIKIWKKIKILKIEILSKKKIMCNTIRIQFCA